MKDMNLRLLQLGDSALPIGGYSQSWGLEAAIDRDEVHDAPTLERWVRCWLRLSVGPLDGVVVSAACRAAAEADWAAVVRVNEFLHAGLTPPTLRRASRDLGEQLTALAERWPWAEPSVAALTRAAAPRSSGTPWYHAPVFATLAAAAGACAADAVLVYLNQAALGSIGAGVRAIPIGHTHGQEILARLHDDLAAVAVDLAERDPETAGSFCPAYEVLCHAQGRLYTRLFRS
jgi:urease accessory protein